LFPDSRSLPPSFTPSEVYARLGSYVAEAPEEYQPVLQTVIEEARNAGPEAAMQHFFSHDYIDGKEPVGPEEFFNNPYYLGEWAKALYPVWKRDLCIVCDPTKRYEEWGLVGAQGTGKTTAAEGAQAYKAYRFSCLRSPWKYFELDPTSKVYFGLFSLSQDKSTTVLYDKFYTLLNQSPYFREKFPSRKKRSNLKSSGGARFDRDDPSEMTQEIVFPSNLRVISGSLTAHALSVDLMSCILDEMNWRRRKSIRPEEDVNSALSLYEQIRTRVKGRFLMKHQTSPGILCTISSKRATTDFMDGLVARMRREPDRCFVSDYALWDAKPGQKFSGKKFYCFIGGSYGQSRIIPPEEEKNFDLFAPNILGVPEEFLPDFEMNINTAMRDIGGISTVPYQLLFENDPLIRGVEDPTRTSPFTADEVYLGVRSDATLDRYFDVEKVTIFDGLNRRPKHLPAAPRYIHIDLSKSQDATGITMLCPSGVRRVSSLTPDGKDASALVPLAWVDFMIRVRAFQNDEIDYDKIRQFLVFLKRIGFRIAQISFDQYQSTDSIQMLAKMGFRTTNLSVDRSDQPYLALRGAFAQKRLNMYQYMPLITELRQLVHDQELGKVDHPDVDAAGGPGSKDVADSLCGAFWGMAQAIAAVKPSTKAPTTVDISRLQASREEIPIGPKAKEFFEGLTGAVTPDTWPVLDDLAHNKIVKLKP
jgi:hypothetical protein